VTGDAPTVLDGRPVRLGESREEIVSDLLDTLTEIVASTVMLMDREFGMKEDVDVSKLGLRYLTPGTRVGDQGRIERPDGRV